jgi:integrase
MMRNAVKDQSFLDLPLGREARRYLNAKRKELTTSSYRGYEGTLHKLCIAFGDLTLQDFELPNGADLIEPWMDDRWGDKAPGTYNVCWSHLSDFFDWQVKRNRMNSNPMRLVGRAKKRGIHRQTFTQDEVKAIIAAAGDLRDRIALRLLFHHGLRKGTLQRVQFKHFDYIRHELTAFTKGQKVQTVPVPESAFWTDLERLLLEWEAQPNHFLMCVVKPVPRAGTVRFPARMMASTTLQRWWVERLEGAGVGYKNMHCARHTFAQMVLDGTQDIKLAQQLLGHASIQTTGDIYTSYGAQQLGAKLAAVLAGGDE